MVPPFLHRSRRALGSVLGAAVVALAAAVPAAPSAQAAPPTVTTDPQHGMMPADSPDAPAKSASTLGGQAQAQALPASGQQTGVDVSGWQHPGGAAIDWRQVAASGQSFAIIKATELSSSLYVNPYLAQDLQGARAAGLVVGTYTYAHPAYSPIAQADAYANAIGNLPPGSLPPVLDIEDVNSGLNPAAMVSWTQAFLGRLQQDTGIVPMIYSSPNYWKTYLGNSTAFSGYPLWVAHYTTASSPTLFGGWPTYALWQYSDGQIPTPLAPVPGITGNVDRNRFNGSSLTALAQIAYPSTFSGPATMNPGVTLRSPNQQYTVVMQSDGNLVEYGNGRALWSTVTGGNDGATLALQTDGNLVVYAPGGRPLWASGTSRPGSSSQLTLQDDGNLTFSVDGARIWANGAPGSDRLTPGGVLTSGQYLHSPAGTAQLIMQSDGNLVLYRYGQARFSTATNRYPSARAVFQGDGNLVVYDASGVARWASQTGGSGANQLVMQGDGNLVMYSPSRAVWATGTS